MNYHPIQKTLSILIVTVSILSLYIINVYAEELKSNNYKIVEVNTKGGGSTQTSNTGNMKLLTSIDAFAGDPGALSSNYRVGYGNITAFIANVPKISCFETNTNGSSTCTRGPAYLNTNGMVSVCGNSGCYDRARFEIDIQKNPTDTLCSIQISTDNFASDIRYIDGITKKPKSTKNLNDYLTKSVWESSTFNIRGLQSSTQYYIRAVALHGDYTESLPGPSINATTTTATISLDIDIDDIDGVSSETSAPYIVTLDNARKLTQSGPPQTALDLIWFDINTNAQSGFVLLHKSNNNGLLSTTPSYTIPSSNVNLDSVTEGYGIQKYYTNQLYHTSSGNGDLGTITTGANYALTGNNIGIVENIFNKLFESDKPIHSGRASIMIKARAASTTPAATDYSDELIFVITPRY